jgi:hypothetical protein
MLRPHADILLTRTATANPGTAQWRAPEAMRESTEGEFGTTQYSNQATSRATLPHLHCQAMTSIDWEP